MNQLTAFSFAEQLIWLGLLIEQVRTEGTEARRYFGPGAEATLMLLAIAESIKIARDHALNCPKKGGPTDVEL